MKNYILIAASLLGAAVTHAASTTLLNEDFSNGSYNSGNHSLTWTDPANGSAWTWSSVNGSVSPNDTETYNSSAVSVRGMAANGGNGGFEVISDPTPSNGTWMVSTRVTLPTSFTTLQSAEASFNYGFRGAVVASTFAVYDATSGKTVFSSPLTASKTGVWSSADFKFDIANFNPGDVVDLQWKSTSSSSSVSLEVGGPVKFSVSSAPAAPAPPLTACLAFAGVLVLQALRSRKTA